KACEYAIRSMIYLADQSQNDIVPISKLSQELEISFTFLTKVLQQLTEKGYLISYKGAKGGVCLGKAPEEISLDDIVQAVSGHNMKSICATGNPDCDGLNPCPLHDRWQPIQKMLGDFYKETNLENYKVSISDKLIK